MRHFRIVTGQAFIGVVPCYVKNADGTQTSIAASSISSLQVVVKVKNGGVFTDYTTTTDAYNNILLNFANGIGNEVYSIEWSGTYGGRKIRSFYDEAFEGVRKNEDATYLDFVVGSKINLPDSVFVLSADTSGINAIIAQLNEKKAEYEAAKAEYEAKVAELTDVAKQTTSTAIKTETDKIGTASAGKPQTVFGAIEGIELDKSDLAKVGSDPTATMTALKTAIAAIPTTQITGYALQGSNANATNTAILAAIPSEEVMKNLYAARAEANQDGTDTYTIVFPYTAQVTETATDIEITI